MRRGIVYAFFKNPAKVIVVGKANQFRNVFQPYAFDDIVFRFSYFFVYDIFDDALAHFLFEKGRTVDGRKKYGFAYRFQRDFSFDVCLYVIFYFDG